MPKPQPTFSCGHPKTAANTYAEPQKGYTHCRECRNASKRAMRLQRKLGERQEARPVSVKYWLYQLPRSMSHYTPEQAVRAIAQAFFFHRGHEPSLILVHSPAQVVKLPDMVVRLANSNEPKPSNFVSFYVR